MKLGVSKMWILEYRGFDVLQLDGIVVVPFRRKVKAQEALKVVSEKLKLKFPRLDWKEDNDSIVALTNRHIYGKVYKANYWKGEYTTLPFIE